MMKFKILYLSLFLLLFLVVLSTCKTEKNAKQNVVYINNQEDFEHYRDYVFTPGTQVLFAAGKSFHGQFAPTGSGTRENPVWVTAYDPETGEIFQENTVRKPIINGNGQVNSAFYLFNSGFWEINNLEITNTDGSDEDQGDLRGIYIVAEDAGIVEDVVVRNCYIHDVNGKVEGKLRGGIHIHVLGNNLKTKFHNLLIENNIVKDVGGVGIGNQSSWSGIDTENFYPWTNVVIRGNRVERTGRNGIIIRNSVNPIVEYNVLAYNSRYSTGHSVFNFNTVGCVMQYNEAYGNTGDVNDIDRGGFDADFNARGTIIQYNYSHDNHWFCGIMKRFNRDVKIRYNVSVNERLAAYMYGFPWDDDARSIWVYNNTHYFRAGLNATVFANPGRTRTPGHTSFYNNIFYFEDHGTWGAEPDETCEFSHNLFYNIEPRGKVFVQANPMLVQTGTVDTDVDLSDPEKLSGFRLTESSPCIDSGLILNENGGKDFWGNLLYFNLPDIGAHEKQP